MNAEPHNLYCFLPNLVLGYVILFSELVEVVTTSS
jgi:hypothetical protein